MWAVRSPSRPLFEALSVLTPHRPATRAQTLSLSACDGAGPPAPSAGACRRGSGRRGRTTAAVLLLRPGVGRRSHGRGRSEGQRHDGREGSDGAPSEQQLRWTRAARLSARLPRPSRRCATAPPALRLALPQQLAGEAAPPQEGSRSTAEPAAGSDGARAQCGAPCTPGPRVHVKLERPTHTADAHALVADLAPSRFMGLG